MARTKPSAVAAVRNKSRMTAENNYEAPIPAVQPHMSDPGSKPGVIKGGTGSGGKLQGLKPASRAGAGGRPA